MSNENQGEQFRQRRRELRPTRAAVAERAGYAVTTVERFENGTERPRSDTIEAFWRTLQLLESYDLPARMQAWRQRHGLSMRRAAQFAGIGEGSWTETELDKRSYRPKPALAARIEALLAGRGDA